jgi:hypothetical protein
LQIIAIYCGIILSCGHSSPLATDNAGIITRQAIRRGTLKSGKELTPAIGASIDACNDRR